MTATLESLLNGVTPPGVYRWAGASDRDVAGAVRDDGWTALELSTHGVSSRDEFYDAVARDWQLPSWFGRNLDALWDVLAERTQTPAILLWDGVDDVARDDARWFDTVMRLLREAVDESAAFAVLLRLHAGPMSPAFSEIDALL